MRITKEIKEGLQSVSDFLEAQRDAGTESELFSHKDDKKIDQILMALEWIAEQAYK